MEIKIDAKCPKCGAYLEFHHTGDMSKASSKPELMNKIFEIGRASSLTSALRKMPLKKTDDFIIKHSALEEIMDYVNGLFRVVGHAESKKELLELRKQIAKSQLRIKRKIENEFKEGKTEVLKEIDKRIKGLSKKKDRKGLAYRGIFDEKKKK